jgi:capsular polysaccharide biosynthesis protein
MADVMSVLRVIGRRWWLILIPTVVATGLSLSSLIALVRPPVSYGLAIKFTASPRPTGQGTFQDNSYTPWLASEYVVTNLSSWVRTESFARELSAALDTRGLKIGAATLQGVIVSDSARSLFTFYVTGWASADDLKQIGEAAITVLATKTDQYFPQLGADKTVIVPLDAVNPVLNTPPLTARLNGLVRSGIGLALGVLLAFAAEFLDQTIRGKREIEALGFAVIGEIPR